MRSAKFLLTITLVAATAAFAAPAAVDHDTLSQLQVREEIFHGTFQQTTPPQADSLADRSESTSLKRQGKKRQAPRSERAPSKKRQAFGYRVNSPAAAAPPKRQAFGYSVNSPAAAAAPSKRQMVIHGHDEVEHAPASKRQAFGYGVNSSAAAAAVTKRQMVIHGGAVDH